MHGSHLFSLTDLTAPSVLSVLLGFVENYQCSLKGGGRGVVLFALVGVSSLTLVLAERRGCVKENFIEKKQLRRVLVTEAVMSLSQGWFVFQMKVQWKVKGGREGCSVLL